MSYLPPTPPTHSRNPSSASSSSGAVGAGPPRPPASPGKRPRVDVLLLQSRKRRSPPRPTQADGANADCHCEVDEEDEFEPALRRVADVQQFDTPAALLAHLTTSPPSWLLRGKVACIPALEDSDDDDDMRSQTQTQTQTQSAMDGELEAYAFPARTGELGRREELDRVRSECVKRGLPVVAYTVSSRASAPVETSLAPPFTDKQILSALQTAFIPAPPPPRALSPQHTANSIASSAAASSATAGTSSYIPLRLATTHSTRALLRATGQTPSASSASLAGAGAAASALPVCLGASVDGGGPRRKSVDVGGVARAHAEAELESVDCEEGSEDGATPGAGAGLGGLLGELFHRSQVIAEGKEDELDDHCLLHPPPTPPAWLSRADLIARLDSWNFQPHALAPADLYTCASLLFEAVLLLPSLAPHLRLADMHPFLRALRRTYHAPNAYHNYSHAIDVLQATYSFLVRLGVAPPVGRLSAEEKGGKVWERTGEGWAARVMSDWDVLALMIAAVGHDVGHPGLSNAFMKNANTPLSEIYNNQSVLENMHCILLVQLLRKHDLGFLIGASSSFPASSSSSSTNPTPSSSAAASSSTATSPTTATATPTSTSASASAAAAPPTLPTPAGLDPKAFRRLCSTTVLATDMSLHFDFMKRFGELIARVREGRERRRGKVDRVHGVHEEEVREEDRVLLLQALIKCGDISNPARPYHVSEQWSKALIEEWAKQASLEQELQLPISVVTNPDAAGQAKSQVCFIELFVEPLFGAVRDVMPELKVYYDQCLRNKARWAERLEQLSAAATAAAASSARAPPSAPASAPPARTPSRPPTLSLTSPNIPPSPSSASTTTTSSTTATTTTDPRFRTLYPLSLPAGLVPPSPSASSASWGGGSDAGGSSGSNGLKKKASFQHRVSWPALPLAGSPALFAFTHEQGAAAAPASPVEPKDAGEE